MSYYSRRRRRFGGAPRVSASAIKQTSGIQIRRAKCAGCGLHIEAGDTFVRLRLRKRFRLPCGTCTQVPKGAKRFHSQCVPVDREKAMGYVPNPYGGPIPNAGPAPAAVPSSHSCAPPPKPLTPEELQLGAIVALEKALAAKLRNHPELWTIGKDQKRVLVPEWEKQFKTFQGLKARVLRPGTDGEEHAATGVALQRLIKMVYAL